MTPVLYILMRTDLASMNPGKAMAQASHASNAFVQHAEQTVGNSVPEQYANFDQWRNETPQGFGTVIVLGVNELEMRTAVEVAQACDLIAGVVHDPTYPLRDGETVHLIPLDTCAYVFGDKENPILGKILGNFSLHP